MEDELDPENTDPDDDNDLDPDGNDDGKGGKAKAQAKSQLTNEEIGRVMAKEKRDGRESGRRALLKELGVENPEELKSIIAAHQKAEDALLSEAERDKRDAAQAKLEAEQERDLLANERFATRLERLVLAAGAPEKQAAKVAALIGVNRKDEPSDEDIADAIGELKKELPALFNRKPGNSNSDPGSGPAGGGGKPTTEQAAAALLAQRHPKSKVS
jgi:hypothetical protein